MYLCRVMNLTIKKADTSDVDLIYALANRIWKLHYPSIISNDQIDYMLDLIYSQDALKQQMLEGQQFLIAYCDQLPIGYISYSYN